MRCCVTPRTAQERKTITPLIVSGGGTLESEHFAVQREQAKGVAAIPAATGSRRGCDVLPAYRGLRLRGWRREGGSRPRGRRSGRPTDRGKARSLRPAGPGRRASSSSMRKSPQAVLDQLRDHLGGALRRGVVERVAAADVGSQADAPCRCGREAAPGGGRRAGRNRSCCVPGESTAQKTQCSMWNIGMCWWITTSSHSGGTAAAISRAGRDSCHKRP